MEKHRSRLATRQVTKVTECNNEGSLTFGYSLEDTDRINGANVFNGQDSVLWINVRDAFWPEITQMYKNLRAAGLSYSNVEARFTEHQSKWPEAVFNEDSMFKYIDPLVNPDIDRTTGQPKEPTSMYLPMMQGSKAEQRKWWLYNRFQYMDSRFNSGDALTDVIQIRCYAKGDITVTPYADVYTTVKYGSYVVSQRATHGVATTLPCPQNIELNDTEVYIYSAAQLASVGDLSGLKIGWADFSKATRLRSIKIGSGASGYSNQSEFKQLDVGTNGMLQTIDLRNCVNLSLSLDLSGAKNVREVYLEGTKVPSVLLPEGGVLETLHLPSTVTNLTIVDQPLLSDLSFSNYANLGTLRLENVGHAVNVMAALNAIDDGCLVRVIGFESTMSTKAQVEAFFDRMDLMRGINESDTPVAKAVLSGIISGLSGVTGEWLAQMEQRYPGVTIRATGVTSVLRYYDYAGSQLLHEETIVNGGDGTWDGVSSRLTDAQYTYQFAGWSRFPDADANDPNAVTDVYADRSVYAAFRKTVRKYTVYWRNPDYRALETDSDVPYGTMPSYDGPTPTYNGKTYTGWEPTPSVVTGNVTYTAVYVPIYVVRFYNGNTVLQTKNVKQGTTATYDCATPQGGTNTEFIGWDGQLDGIVSDTDFHALFRPVGDKVVEYVEGTLDRYDSNGTDSLRRKALGNLGDLSYVRTYASDIGTEAFTSSTSLTTVDLANESSCSVGKSAFSYANSLKHLVIRSSSMASIDGYTMFDGSPLGVGEGGVYVPTGLVGAYRNNSYWGKLNIYPLSEYPRSTFLNEITDSWSQIATASANGTYSTRYGIGDVKVLDLGSGGRIRMQLIAMDVDDLTGGGKAHMTWVSRDCLANKRPMGSTTSDGWPGAELREWLNTEFLNSLPESLPSAIKPVNKTSNVRDSDAASTNSIHLETSSDRVWIPSAREAERAYYAESSGARYEWFSNGLHSTRLLPDGSKASYWARTAYRYDDNYFLCVQGASSYSIRSAASDSFVVIGFCI